jgi:hypothetical protein
MQLKPIHGTVGSTDGAAVHQIWQCAGRHLYEMVQSNEEALRTSKKN